MAPKLLAPLTNPLATAEQLASTGSQLDGVSPDLEASLRFHAALLTQAAGILLRLPQDVVAQAIVTLLRFYVGAEGSFRVNAAEDISAAALYLAAKLSPVPQSPRSLINVYAYLLSPGWAFFDSDSEQRIDPSTYYVSEDLYQTRRTRLFATETLLLRTTAFTTHTTLPHPLALTYLQTLGVLSAGSHADAPAARVAQRVLEHLNAALLSPQLLYLTHQPHALAVAAVYLGARQAGVPLCATPWWEVFDVDRDQLGFLVVAFGSLEAWVSRERSNWHGRACPMSLSGLEAELQLRAESTQIDD